MIVNLGGRGSCRATALLLLRKRTALPELHFVASLRNPRLHPVSNGKSLMMADMSEIVRQAAIGLHATHEQMIIHHDVKPSNLMLTLSPDGHVLVKILDFGVAISR